MTSDRWLAVLVHSAFAEALESAGVHVVVTDDVDAVVGAADAPVVLIGHFTGAPVAARYAQHHGAQLAALVLVSPVLGMWDGASDELADLIDEVNFGPHLGALPTLWLHGEADEIVPISDTRAGTDRIRGMAFEEHIAPGLLDPKDAVNAIRDFVDRIL
ncbi:lysophospholipase [Lentzea tibetensis]|uniref:Lysophospholipase n=1 Tax=Lentzea tibetensis TaxID=2591470 RepID=A0A563ER48_9PSEU|nr:lysophospholipase [Lentzea tibetensis]TWP49975.1 lysophospholipase [Lentzea tibetensis]